MVAPILVAAAAVSVIVVVAAGLRWRQFSAGTPDGTQSASSDLLGSTHESARSLPGRLLGFGGRLLGRVFGSEHQLPIRGLLVFALVSLGLAAVAALSLLTSGASVQSSSGPLLRWVLELLTTWYIYVLAFFATIVLGYLFLWDIIARKTADVTAFSHGTVKQLSDEIKTRDGTLRVIGTADHSVNDLMVKLEYALRNQGDLVDEVPDNVDDQYPIGDQRDTAAGALRSKDMPALEAPDDAASDAPEGDVDADPAEAAPDGYDEFFEAWGDCRRAAFMLARDLAETGEYAAEITSGYDLGLVKQKFEELGVSPEALEDASTAGDLADAIDAADGADGDGGDDVVEASSDVDPSPGRADEMSLREQFSLFRMDFFTAKSFDDILVRFLTPAAVTAGLLFTLLRTFWLSIPGYIAVFSTSAFVASLFYVGSMVRRQRRLEKHRQDDESEPWGSAAVLVQRVDTPEVTAYIMHVAGHTYVDYDRDRLVRKGARRWYQAIHTESIWPSIQEKFARNVQQMVPTLNEFLRNDPHEGMLGIYYDMVAAVEQSADPEGVVPKQRLGELVVERGPGRGHDPELVARAYQQLYRWKLQEHDITVHDMDGEQRKMTVVHLREAPVRDDIAQVMAEHSEQFNPKDRPKYPLPGVDEPSMLDDPIASRVDTAGLPDDGVDAPAPGWSTTPSTGD